MTTHSLAEITLFSSLPPDEIKRLETSLQPFDCPAGQVFMQEGHRDNEFYILLKGQVEIFKSLDHGEQRVLGTEGAGSLLGEMSLFSREGRHTASVRAVTPLHLLKMTRLELDTLLQRQPQFAYALVRMMSQRMEDSENITILDLKEKNRRLTQAYDELKAAQEQIIEKERLEKELEISGQIQQSILPDSLPTHPGFEFGAMMIPARQVGGDFYTFFKLDGDRLGMVVGDVSDKGVPAALFMALTYSLIRAEAARTNSPVEALREVNRHLLQMNSSTMFVTLVYGILDCASGEFHFARAAHPSPFLLDHTCRVVEVPVSPGQPLGLFDDLPIDEQHIQVSPGGILILYSDGVNEAQNTEGVEFGLDSLHRSLAGSGMCSAQDVCDRVWQDVQLHSQGLPQHDDFTIVVLKRKAGQ